MCVVFFNFRFPSSRLYSHPTAAHELLRRITDASSAYVVAQVRSGGAQMIQIFDTWAGELSPELWREFALPYMLSIAREVRKKLL